MQFKFFPHFFENHPKFRFENQEVDEQIELLLRRHPITNLGWIVMSVIAFVFPVIILKFDQILGINLSLTTPLRIITAVLVFYYMLVFIYFIERFLDWYFNVAIVTDQHVVDINFNSLLSKDVIEVGLEDVESLSIKTGGVLDSLLDYGDVSIMTAAEKHNIEFTDIHRPSYVVDKIQDLVEQRKLFFEGDTE
jgi:membrane protein YdbS with pleckstrin-like domain